MNKIIRSIAVLAIFLTLGISSSIAQGLSFDINYSGCDLTTTHYSTKITCVIVKIPGGDVVFGPNIQIISYPEFGGNIDAPDFTCDESTEELQYMVIIHIDLLDENSEVKCTGDLRTSLMSCSDLYELTELSVLLN